MMKLAWLCYSSDYNEKTGEDEESIECIRFREPNTYYSRVVPIVYAEIEE